MTIASTCTVDHCEARAWTKGMCQSHYHRWRRYGDPLAGKTNVRRDGRAATGRCSMPECDDSAYRMVATCGEHYQLPGLARREVRRDDSARSCGATECDKAVFRDGLCAMHHSRRRRASPTGTTLCNECGLSTRRVGMCTGHFHRVKTHGHPNLGGAPRAPGGTGSVDAHGYRYVWFDGVKRPEHRLVSRRDSAADMRRVRERFRRIFGLAQ